MPAPLAKGIIVSISLLLAASLAIYENPQVKQWVDESRRKIAFALHHIGDDLDPSDSSRRNSAQDASTREYDTVEAVERRRKARQEILERGRMMEERRRSKQASTAKSRSFDDIVDEDGKLKHDSAQATTSATEPNVESASGLRSRNIEAHGAALGSAVANPFVDEACIEDFSTSTFPVQTSTHRSRSSSTATLPASPPAVPPKEPITSPPVPPKEPLDSWPSTFSPQVQRQEQQSRLLIDTDDVSNHPSEALVDLTPTTSAPSSIAAVDLSELEHDSYPSNNSQSNFWSVHEWAENNSAPAGFYSPPRSEAAAAFPAGTQAVGIGEAREESSTSGEDVGSEIGSIERVSRVGSVSEDMDVMSEVSGIDTPAGSWSEVASQVSDDF
ncbi:MAG: hypothetical protein Q9212_002777 [Teloschistes hypoglaucus]